MADSAPSSNSPSHALRAGAAARASTLPEAATSGVPLPAVPPRAIPAAEGTNGRVDPTAAAAPVVVVARPKVVPPQAAPTKANRKADAVATPVLPLTVDAPTADTIVRRRQPWPAWLVSAVFHGLLVILLACLTLAPPGGQGLLTIDGSFGDPGPDLRLLSARSGGGSSSDPSVTDALEAEALELPVETLVVEHPIAIAKANRKGGRGVGLQELTDSAFGVEGTNDGSEPNGGGFEGRSPDRRRILAGEDGATEESETAVKRGLEWLVAHQKTDGSWQFNHLGPTCPGLCRHPGKVGSSTGSTGLALLAFLGAGQTHRDGEYQEPVRKAVYYLSHRLKRTTTGGDLQEGSMYSQGIASTALCEAFALTQDKELHDVAQSALDFIVAAQDQRGGGWRYYPGQPGDTSVLGWQMMALKSGEFAYLEIPPRTWLLAGKFLDSVQTDKGASYGYLKVDETPSTTAIGLLGRMYLGWRKDHPALEQGVLRLAKRGPMKDDMYYNYYATQVLHHWGGPPWQQWNPKMRDFLVAAQGKQGHESGSWQFDGNNGNVGGRIYNTTLAIMTLEVYYRYLPLYKRPAEAAQAPAAR